MIFLFSIFILIVIVCYSYLLSRIKHEFIVYVFAFSLLLTPSTKLLGLYSESILNININQAIIYLLILLFPLSIISRPALKNNSQTLMNYYYKNIGISLAFVIIAFLFNILINSIYYRVSIFALPKYHLIEFISVFVVLHSSLLLFNKIEPQRMLIILKNIWVTLVMVSALFGVLFILDINF